MINDDPVPLEPTMLSFEPVKVDGQHVLWTTIHTADLGKFTLPFTPVQAEVLAESLLDYLKRVADYEETEMRAA